MVGGTRIWSPRTLAVRSPSARGGSDARQHGIQPFARYPGGQRGHGQLRAGGGGGRAPPPGRRLVCPRCGCLGRGAYDRRSRRWRHLDVASTRLSVECELRRFGCPGCRRVVTEAVAWARPGARFRRDFEDLVGWLAQQAAFSVIARLLCVSWRSVARIVARVVADQLDQRRLRDLERIGIDEVSYRRGHRYLTLVCDHRSGAVVWVGRDRSQATLERFF